MQVKGNDHITKKNSPGLSGLAERTCHEQHLSIQLQASFLLIASRDSFDVLVGSKSGLLQSKETSSR